jgi:hypothetical protein
MSNDINQAISFANTFLQQSSSRKTGLTEAEKLVINIISQGTTYKKAGIQYQYTESSLQNVASGLFKELSKVVGVTVNRRNFIELLEKERLAWQQAHATGEFVFDRLQATLWTQQDRASLVSISYNANQELDLTSYLLDYSPFFEATFCLEVSSNNSVLELLWSLCNRLQAPLPVPRNDQSALFKSIGLALKQRSTLLLLRFDREASPASPQENQSSLVSERHNLSEYAEILAMLGLAASNSCILTLDNDSVGNEAELRQSLAYQLQLMVNKMVGKLKMEPPRLVLIENDVKIVCSILQTYLQKGS